MKMVKRYLDLDLADGQSCILWGARKTGKSTFLHSNYPNSIYIDLLQADVFERYLRSPNFLREELLLLDRNKNYIVVVDEVQKVPLLMDEIHWLIESCKNIQFILCGSSARSLKSKGANLLGGRAWRAHMVPLCYPELKQLDWKKIFNNGLIPSHYFSSKAERSLSAYIYDYVLTEVHLEANIRKRESFAKFLDVLGFAQGELLNYSNIARDCGIDSKTVRTYFEILEDMYLGYFLRPYKSNTKRQTIRETPKFYLFDTGMASYLRRYNFTEMVGTEAGKAFEHYIFLELMAYKLLKFKREEITFWRTKEGYEVDFIIQDKAFEVKLSNNIKKEHIKGLLELRKDHKKTLYIICFELKKRIIKLDNCEIVVLPVEDFLKLLWDGLVWV
jgi:uncharacterized protein